MMNERLGKIHFCADLYFFQLAFFPMHFLGVGGHMRRIYNPTQYEFLTPMQHWNVFITVSALILGASQIFFCDQFFWSLFAARRRNGIRGRPILWNGSRRRRRRTAISKLSRWSTAGPTNTARRKSRKTGCRRTSNSVRRRRGAGALERRSCPSSAVADRQVPTACRAVWPHRLAARPCLRDISFAFHRRPRHQQRRRPCRTGLADDLRLQHVPLPMVQNGRQYFLRTQPSFGCFARRFADHCVDLGVLVSGAAPLAAPAWSRGAIVGYSARSYWRPAGRFAGEHTGDCSRGVCPSLFCLDGESGYFHFAGLA